MAHLLKSSPRKNGKPPLAHVRAMIAELKEDSRRKDAIEDAAIARRGRTSLPRTRALPEGSGRMECFIPKRRYWRLRRKYGREIFTTDAGQKDLRRHHPEWFTETVADRPSFSLSAAGRDNYESIFGHK